MRAQSMVRRAAVVTFAALSPLGLLAACGGDDGSSATATTVATTTTSPEEAMCADRDALVASIQGLTDVDIVADGTDGVREALTDIQDSLGELRESAADNFAPEVDAMGEALDALQDVLADVGAAGVSGVVDSVSDVISAGGDLGDRLQSIDCGE